LVDPVILTSDIVETVVYLATPAVLWLFLYLVAWEDARIARESGFGRRTFWLLLPIGVIASTIVALPFFGWDGDVLAINLTGGAFPIVLSGLFLWRCFGASERVWGRFFVALTVETIGLFAIVVLVPGPWLATGAILAVCLATPLLLWTAGPASVPGGRTGPAAPLALGLTSMSLFLTFVTTQPVVGAGIESIFPYYLLAPIVVGIVAVPIMVQGLSAPPGTSLSLAYAASTLGTLIGADVLRQPPLYGVGQPAFLEIGGAGLLDLLYLSGLLAAAAAYGYLRISERNRLSAPVAEEPPEVRTPTGLLQQALMLGAAGRSVESAATSAQAAESAAIEARRWTRAPAAPTDHPWSGLGLPPWVEADHANLQALARGGHADAIDAGRAWNTSQWLVRIGREIGQRRLATSARRGAAFGIDLAVTLPLAVIVWVVAAVVAGSGFSEVANSVVFNAAAVGYPAYAFVYLAVAEATTGTTLGKWVVGIEVTGRDEKRPGPLAVLIRNVPKLVPLELVGIGGALITAFLIGASAPATPGGLSDLGLDALLFSIVLAVLVPLSLFVGWVGIQVSPERQRIGDFLAGTWVLHRVPRPPSG
jgi:uncharacterized RDD family membrane protein YckC